MCNYFMFDFYKKDQNGFSLIELLVAITVIGILASVSYVGFGKIQASARDDKRVGDLAMIKMALRSYSLDNDDYPVTGHKISIGGEKNKDKEFSSALEQKYIKVLPKDPLYPQKDENGKEYYYFYKGEKDPDSFVVCARTESKSGFSCACLDEKVNSKVSYLDFAACPDN